MTYVDTREATSETVRILIVDECPGCDECEPVELDEDEQSTARFWQTPTFTERDLSEARTDAWNRGYDRGLADADMDEAYDEGYNDGARDVADVAANFAVTGIAYSRQAGRAEGRRVGMALGVFIGTLAVLAGYVIAANF